MPLRCYDPSAGRSIHAFDLSPKQWQELGAKNRELHHLRMPCCSSQVVLKKSSLRTQFFAHKRRGNCTTAPETEAHLRLKRMAVEAARANKWDAKTEAHGESEVGNKWKADVFARKGKTQVAVEIQWSRQTDDETWRRQKRYEESGVRCLWLFRQSDFPIDRRLPAACIGGTPEEGYIALIPTGAGWQSMPMKEFLRAVFFGKRLRFGLPPEVATTVAVRAGHMFCYSCGCETQIVTGIEVAIGPHNYRFSIPEIGEHPELFGIVRSHLPHDLSFKAIKRRYSKTQGRSYLSNGCAHCGALLGEFYEHHAWDDQETICTFQTRTSERWRDAIIRQGQHEEGWGVFCS